ncbi:hypothetical protein BGZ60DRAFT_474568 [Tricladium varicosporioides]|nr:hypothetical protein BGZ60DRAFT_474568 [Hymenoscyphus varicosporioides]
MLLSFSALGQFIPPSFTEVKAIKQLYYQLHSLEKFPEVLPKARKLLLSLLRETSAAAQGLPEHESILSISSFSRQSLDKFQHTRDHKIGEKWEQYNIRRKEGGPRELFCDREEAIWWLKQIAPVKYVDGAWLGHIGKVTTPFALRKTSKIAWQVLSEELGDGDLEKNHVHLYQKLLKSIAPGLPTAEELDFTHPRHGLDELAVWKSAIAQLLISLFPREFLPEILGFNLHFEAISMDTLKAGKELQEVKIDPYYFILHVSIDNADSGHTAIAMEVVYEYMDYIQRLEGDQAAQKVWERIQAGYLLSQGLPGTAVCPSQSKLLDNASDYPNPTELEVMRIFKAKARVGHKIHCRSRVKIGSRSLEEWLDPVACESKKWQKSLLCALSRSKYWICRGDSNNSRFIRELAWNGRMFGCFTKVETEVLKRWIDDLPNISLDLESTGTEKDTLPANNKDEDILSEYPVFRPSSDLSLFDTHLQSSTPMFTFQKLPSLDIGGSPIFEKFLPLWISHPCLLQSFVSVPFRTNNNLGSTVVKILRAQMGFDIEQEYVAGMDEVRRPDSFGLLGIGIKMMAQHGLETLPALKEVLQVYPSDFAVHMLHTSMRPMEYKGILIGMATAFAKMHSEITRSTLLSELDQAILEKIVQRELEGLEACWKELALDNEEYTKCCKGYLIARDEIRKCFFNAGQEC